MPTHFQNSCFPLDNGHHAYENVVGEGIHAQTNKCVYFKKIRTALKVLSGEYNPLNIQHLSPVELEGQWLMNFQKLIIG